MKNGYRLESIQSSGTGQLTVKAETPDRRITDVRVYSSSKALLIGNAKYSSARGWDPLPSVPGELLSVKNALMRQGFVEANIKVVADTKSEGLSREIRSFLLEDVSRNARLFVYYAGHGFSPDDISGFLVPVDAPAESDPGFAKTLLGMSEIIEWSKRSLAKHVFFVFDSCFSGTIFLSRSSNLRPNQLFLNEADRPVRQFLTSGSAKERVPAISDFAKKFVEGMDGAADLYADGIVTANELGYWLKAEITPLGKQTPQYGSLSDLAFRFGDTVFLANKGMAQSKLPMTADPKLIASKSVATSSSLGVPSNSAPEGFKGIDVYYYQKLGDKTAVSDALEKAKIPFVKTRASRPQEESTNGLACGPDVPVSAIKAVAHGLIAGGVTLNVIFPYAEPGQKRRRLEVLTNPLRTGAGLRNFGSGGLTSDQVDRLTGCPT